MRSIPRRERLGSFERQAPFTRRSSARRVAGALLSLPNASAQVHVIDANTLREAQNHPDAYRNLLVRGTGNNAYFVGLGKEIQDEIIARESHVIWEQSR